MKIMRMVLKMMALEMKMVMIVSRAIVTDTTARAGVHALHCLLLIRPLGKRKYTLHPHLSHHCFVNYISYTSCASYITHIPSLMNSFLQRKDCNPQGSDPKPES